MDKVLECNNLSKFYKKRKAVDSVSFSVHAGEIFGFLGPNGAGKSTTIKMITGLIKKTSGDILICGFNLETDFEKAISNIGAIIEYPSMYSYMSGLDNLKFYAGLYKNIKKDKIQKVIELVGLQNRIKDKVSKYSLGMKQRLGIAQALLCSPKLLILDEPTNGLDANGIAEMRKFLKDIAKNENVAIMVSSHILSEMENLCSRIAIINDGKIVEVKTMEEIKHKASQNASVYIKTKCPNLAGKMIIEAFGKTVKVKGEIIFIECDENLLAELIVLLTKNRVPIFGAGIVENTLEEAFLKITSSQGTEIK